MHKDKENRILNELADINRDASSFYKGALERIRNPRLERSFMDLEKLHDSVASDLARQIRMNGGEADVDGTLAGKTAQLFGELLAKVSNDADETLVSRLEEAEDRCLHSMREALDDKHLQPETRALLIGELGTLQRSHDYMKALKDSMAA